MHEFLHLHFNPRKSTLVDYIFDDFIANEIRQRILCAMSHYQPQVRIFEIFCIDQQNMRSIHIKKLYFFTKIYLDIAGLV
jgi:hypothetical protein